MDPMNGSHQPFMLDKYAIILRKINTETFNFYSKQSRCSCVNYHFKGIVLWNYIFRYLESLTLNDCNPQFGFVHISILGPNSIPISNVLPKSSEPLSNTIHLRDDLDCSVDCSHSLYLDCFQGNIPKYVISLNYPMKVRVTGKRESAHIYLRLNCL
jgi:hypothetical protein